MVDSGGNSKRNHWLKYSQKGLGSAQRMLWRTTGEQGAFPELL